MKSLHPEFKEDGALNRKLVGRAVTAMYAPARPDYVDAQFAMAKAKGLTGTPNQWVVDHLQPRDVMVIDMYDKVYKGTFLGGNLTTVLHNKTGNGGAVIWGGIRDIKDIFRFEMITQNKFTTAQSDKNTWTESMLDMLMEFIRTDERGEPYRNLDWSREYDLARNGDPNDT